MNQTVWYISKYFAPKTKNSPGGRSWFLMKELADKGYNAIVISSDSNQLIEAIKLKEKVLIQHDEGIKIIWLKTIKYSVAKSVRRILSWLHFELNLLQFNDEELEKPDVIVVSSLSLLTIVNGVRLSKKYKCRLIFEVRDIWPLTIIEEGGFSRFNPLVVFLSILEKLAYNKSDAIIGTMPNLAAHVQKISSSSSPVYCIPMGISDDQMNNVFPLEEEYANNYLFSNKFKIVHAGTIGITNALDVLFQVAEMLEDNPEIEFLIVGDGPLREHYFAKYGHKKNIVFAPKVNKNQVQSVLALCDLVYFSVFPSKVWDYGQSLNKVIDYMLSGKPIIASYSGYNSMINEANCGSFVPAGDAEALMREIKRYVSMTLNDRTEIGLRGKNWLIKNRTYKKLAKEFSDILFSRV